jgi:Cu2+-exporting ATPase
MTKTMKIQGMMCPHCSGRVKNVLEALPQVVSAEVDHQTDSAVVTLKETLSDDVLKEVVEKEGYQVTGIG